MSAAQKNEINKLRNRIVWLEEDLQKAAVSATRIAELEDVIRQHNYATVDVWWGRMRLAFEEAVTDNPLLFEGIDNKVLHWVLGAVKEQRENADSFIDVSRLRDPDEWTGWAIAWRVSHPGDSKAYSTNIFNYLS